MASIINDNNVDKKTKKTKENEKPTSSRSNTVSKKKTMKSKRNALKKKTSKKKKEASNQSKTISNTNDEKTNVVLLLSPSTKNDQNNNNNKKKITKQNIVDNNNNNTVQGYARKPRKRFGINAQSSPFQNIAALSVERDDNDDIPSIITANKDETILVHSQWNNTFRIPSTSAVSTFSICKISSDEDDYDDINTITSSSSTAAKFKPLSREELVSKLANDDETNETEFNQLNTMKKNKTKSNNNNNTNNIIIHTKNNTINSNKVDEFFPEWTKHTGGAIMPENSKKKKYKRRTKKELTELRRAKAKARLDKMNQEEMKRRATRHLQCLQKLRLRRFSMMPPPLRSVSKDSTAVIIMEGRQSLSNNGNGNSNNKNNNNNNDYRRDSISIILNGSKNTNNKFRPSLAPVKSIIMTEQKKDSVNTLTDGMEKLIVSTSMTTTKTSMMDINNNDNNNSDEERDSSNIAAVLRLAFEFLSAKDLLLSTMSVSHLWSHTSNTVASWVSASESLTLDNINDIISVSQNLLTNWKGMQTAFPWGCFLAEGAYKSVYKVWNNTKKRMEAISVMDVKSILEMGNEEVIRQEVQVSTLLSELVTDNKCPNFIETYQVFQFAYAPPETLWKMDASSTCKYEKDFIINTATKEHDNNNLTSRKKNTKRTNTKTKRKIKTYKPKVDKSCHMYIRMELCDGGDLETYLRNEDDVAIGNNGRDKLSETEILAFMFQMIISLAIGQDEMNLRHYDVKLLNFFLKRVIVDEDEDAADSNDDNNKNNYSNNNNKKKLDIKRKAKEDNVSIASYLYHDQLYNITAPRDRPYIVKLADYGTADISPETLGLPITMAQFTTLENVSPDFYILGTNARQDFNADSFSLGLSFLHLLTGSMPYEEILEEVTCPPALIEVWRQTWGERMAVDNNNNNNDDDRGLYVALKRILRYDENINTVPNTLYRFFVMLGLPNMEHDQDEILYDYKENPILNVMKKMFKLSFKKRSSNKNKSKTLKGKGKLWDKYSKQCKEFNIFNGTNEYMQRGQKRMENIRGSKDLLKSLLHYNPNKRITMRDAIEHETFYLFLKKNN